MIACTSIDRDRPDFDELPEQDQQRIKRDGQAAADAFIRAYAAFAGIRHPITETETDTVGIERMDPIAGATRVLVGMFADAGEALLRNNESGGYDSPAEIEAAFDLSVAEEITADHPGAVYKVAEIFPQLASGTGAILDYLTQLRLPQQQQMLLDPVHRINLLISVIRPTRWSENSTSRRNRFDE
jgi:hypothetical protein